MSEATRQPLERPSLANESFALKKQGDAYFDQGKLSEAATCYREAIVRNPSYAEAYNNWGNACRVLGLIDDAERHLRTAAKLKPALANVHYNLASLLLARGKLEEAITNLASAVEREPKHYAALAILVHLKQKTCDWCDLDSKFRLLRSSVFTPVESPEQVFSPFVFIALPGTTLEEQKRCAERWVRAEYQSLIELRPSLAFTFDRTRNGKISVGYFSADFREHPVARLIAPVIELHDRERFQVRAYSYGPDDGSEMRKRLQRTFDQFVDIRNISDIDAARRIYADKIDILVDLTGFTENSRSGVLALRPAPLQLSYLGYLGTMGAGFVDYLIADEFVIPKECQKGYSERILYLPNCFQSNDRTRPRPAAPSRKSCGLPEDAFVFCCFNQPYKITPEIFDTWCRLLIAVPGSVLWLYSSTPSSDANLKREARTRGVEPSRLVMASRVSPKQYLARMQCADLFLDTTPYNAGTTCSDALWVGLPVVTCVGTTFSARMAGSLLSAIQVPELVAYSLADYYQIALSLAVDRHALDKIRDKIAANRDTAPLFNGGLFIKNLETAYAELAMHAIPDAMNR